MTAHLYCLDCGASTPQPATRCTSCRGIYFTTVPVAFPCGHVPQTNSDCCQKHCVKVAVAAG